MRVAFPVLVALKLYMKGKFRSHGIQRPLSAQLLASSRSCEANEAKHADFVPTHDLNQWHQDKGIWCLSEAPSA